MSVSEQMRTYPPPPYGMNPDPNGARLGRGTCALGSGSDADIDMKWLTIFFQPV